MALVKIYTSKRKRARTQIINEKTTYSFKKPNTNVIGFKK
jgi:hypothetical protein